MRIVTNKDGLHIELRGREQFWALRAKVSVAPEIITDIKYETQFNNWRKWQVRMPGTHAPRLLLAGSYWTEEGWDFLYIKRPIGFINPRVNNVLVVETSQDRYKRVIVSCDDETAKEVLNWWQKRANKQKKAKRK